MAEDYRKPASSKSPAPARGTVVRQPEGPPERPRAATGADPRNKERFAREAAMAAAELEAAKRSMAITSRVLGAILVAIVLGTLLLSRSQYVELGYLALSGRGRVAMGLGASLGPWLIVFGNGGAATPRDAPDWYRYGAIGVSIAGVVLAETGTLIGVMESLLALTT